MRVYAIQTLLYPKLWALAETCSLGRPETRATARVELFVRTCVFLSPDILPAVFSWGCPSPSDCHTDKSASQVPGRGVVKAVP